MKNLKGDIVHYTYPRGLQDLVAASTRYASCAAEARHEAGKKFSWLSLLCKPPATFLKKYLLQLGFLDGLPGLAISAGSAYCRFVREAMIWQLEHTQGQPPLRPPAATGGETPA